MKVSAFWFKWKLLCSVRQTIQILQRQIAKSTLSVLCSCIYF